MSRRRLGVLAVVLGVIGFMLAIELTLAQPPPSHPQHNGQTYRENAGSEPESQRSETFWQRTVTDPTAFFTLWVAIFTAFLAVSTIGLWLATYRQARLGREEFAATHRPEIIVHSIEFRRMPGVDEVDRIGASILCFNKGRSTAKSVEMRGHILVTDELGIDVQRPLIKTLAEVPSGMKLRFEVHSDRPVRELPYLIQTGLAPL
jgi:hypothetical protein